MKESVEHTHQITKEFKKYYEALFKNKPRTPQGMLEAKVLLQKLQQKEIRPKSRQVLNAPIKTKEVVKVMQHLPLGK